MTNAPWSMFSPWSQTIDKFVNNPITSWQRFFNPQVVFNYNPQDEPIEAHVLSRVGSYGRQLSVLIDVIDILASRIDETGLPEEQKKMLSEFATLKKSAQEAIDEARGLLDADAIFDAAEALQKRDPEGAVALKERLDAVLKKK